MKIKEFNKKQGFIKLEVSRPEDCWVLTHIIEPSDLVRATTIRKIKKGGEDDRKATVIKKPMTLTLEVEKTELAENSIRILGVIRDGPDDVARGSYHTIALEPSQTCTITKPNGWSAYHQKRLDDATKEPPHQILIIVHDREEAIIASLSEKVKILTRIKGNVAKKDQDQKAENFYKQLAKVVKEYQERLKPNSMLLASPAFFKEDFLKECDQELKKKIVLATVSDVSANGIQELLRRDEVKSALAKDRVSQHMHIVEEIFKEIAHDGKAAYGTKEVENAANAGAILTLVITEQKIKQTREDKNFEKIDNILMVADKTGASIAILDSTTPPGKKIDGLGGIAAVLRYKL